MYKGKNALRHILTNIWPKMLMMTKNAYNDLMDNNLDHENSYIMTYRQQHA